jgi:hypothetical protein
MEDGQLLPQPVCALAQRADPSPDRGDMLTDGKVDPVTVDGQIALSTSASKPRMRVSTHEAPQ